MTTTAKKKAVAPKKKAIAVGCHPDDIEFMMSGTLLMLQKAGYEVHYMTVANGSLGTDKLSREQIVAKRRSECIAATKLAGMIYHESVCDDIEVFYNYDLICKVAEVIRAVDPDIVLTHGPYDYMEDHTCTGRLAVTAAFCRGMTNLRCRPDYPATLKEVAVYHSMPHSLTDPLRRPVIPELYVNISSVMKMKENMLRCHASQKEWLDVSQGNDAYIEELTFRAKYFGKMSGKFPEAEGWIRHNHLGFGAENFNPLLKDLGKNAFMTPRESNPFLK